MTGKQHAVMWLGILLILTRMFTSGQWGSIWATVGKTSATVPAGTKTSAVIRGGPTGNIQDWSASGGAVIQAPGTQLA